jgi:hypothetical protein
MCRAETPDWLFELRQRDLDPDMRLIAETEQREAMRIVDLLAQRAARREAEEGSRDWMTNDPESNDDESESEEELFEEATTSIIYEEEEESQEQDAVEPPARQEAEEESRDWTTDDSESNDKELESEEDHFEEATTSIIYEEDESQSEASILETDDVTNEVLVVFLFSCRFLSSCLVLSFLSSCRTCRTCRTCRPAVLTFSIQQAPPKRYGGAMPSLRLSTRLLSSSEPPMSLSTLVGIAE